MEGKDGIWLAYARRLTPQQASPINDIEEFSFFSCHNPLIGWSQPHAAVAEVLMNFDRGESMSHEANFTLAPEWSP